MLSGLWAYVLSAIRSGASPINRQKYWWKSWNTGRTVLSEVWMRRFSALSIAQPTASFGKIPMACKDRLFTMAAR